MGQVRFVQRTAIEQQLVAGNLVLLTNIGVSSSGELLNCNVFDVSCVEPDWALYTTCGLQLNLHFRTALEWAASMQGF